MMFRPDLPPPTKYQYASVIDVALVRFNPSRAILGLEARGFVLRRRDCRHANLALTAEGFAEARRLRGIGDTALVDVDQLAARWREREDFALGLEGSLGRPDGPFYPEAAAKMTRGTAMGSDGGWVPPETSPAARRLDAADKLLEEISDLLSQVRREVLGGGRQR